MTGCSTISSNEEVSGKIIADETTTDTTPADETNKSADRQGAFVGTKEQAYFMCVFKQNTPYWEGVFRGFKAAGDQLGIRTIFVGCDEYDINAQLKVFDEIVAKKPKGIAIHPINPNAFKEPINKAIESGIKVTCFAADSPESKRLTLVTSDNVEEGRFAADYIADKLGNQMEIGIIERPNQTNHVKRVEAFIGRLEEKYPNIKVVARESADGDETKAAMVAQEMIKKYPNISLLYCVAGIEGMGAGAGVKESGKPVKVFCYDADPGVIDMIKEGTIFATSQPNTVNQGYWSMMCLYIAANNLIDPISDWKVADKSPLPALIDNGLDIVTKENCEYFYVK
jgi:ribose transport system substrate-binding protein